MTTYRNLDECATYKTLKTMRCGIPELSRERIAACSIPVAAGLTYNWSASPVDESLLSGLGALAAEQELIAKFRLLAGGAVMNTGEKRLVLHHLARGELAGSVLRDGVDLRKFYEGERLKAARFAEAIHAGMIRGSTGRQFATAVQIGIGGSDLGPRACHIALERWARKHGKLKMRAFFISNVDPDDADSTLQKLDLESTIFILVSKSGTTQETLANETLVRARLEAAGLDPRRHMVAVTSQTSPLAGNPEYLESFYIDDFIGGRYSTSSAVGGVILSLAFGPEIFAEFLEGAHEADLAAMEPDIGKNASMLDAMIGLYERNVLDMPCTAVLPYAEALSRFPAHLQQLDMESNGKSVNRAGEALGYATGPVVFGEPGTNGQHSFYQLLHQGTDIVPLQFIGFAENQESSDVESGGSTSRRKLLANLAAQIVAFARGRDSADPNRRFAGGRPSVLIFGRELGPRQMGALLAHYENKVMFQGFAWNINSFDQEGVQLGKVLAGKVLSGSGDDPALAAYAELVGLNEPSMRKAAR